MAPISSAAPPNHVAGRQPTDGKPLRSAVRSCGVPVQVHCEDRRQEARARAILAANATPCDFVATGVPTFGLSEGRHGACNLTLDGALIAVDVEPGIAITILDAEVRARIAAHAPDHVIVHAGAVAHRGRGIVLPGPSFAGKTTLVAALLAAGASYLSDELAVIDAQGMLHAFPRPLSLRDPETTLATRVAAAQVAPHAPAPPAAAVPIGLVAIATYEPQARWAPEQLTPGQGALALLANTPAARTDAPRILPILSRATGHATVLRGPRGDAAATARAILASVER
jgi:hypothetical protein